MNYTYTSLMRAAETMTKLGEYKGYEVYSISVVHLVNEQDPGIIYCLYDYDNLLVKYNSTHGRYVIYGTLDVNGHINDSNAGKIFYGPKNQKNESKNETKNRNEMKNETKTNDGNEMKNEPIIADVRLEIEVENTLKKAREMSIDSLLAGFNYGLEIELEQARDRAKAKG